MSFRLLSILLALAMLVPSVFAATIHVPADQPTIQAGINAANPSDTVLVSDGVYYGSGNLNISFGASDIILMSENGPQSTVIDCEGTAPAFNINSGHDTTLVIDGFTITNGHHAAGGAVRNFGSSPTIARCVFLNNSATYGGAIYHNGLPNKDIDGQEIDPPTLRLRNCTFVGNTSTQGGSTIYTQHSNATVEIERTIFCANVSGIPDCPTVLGDPNDPGIIILSCSDIFGNSGGDWIGGIVSQATENGNFSLDPQFCNAPLENFQIAPTSPCTELLSPCGEIVGALEPCSEYELPFPINLTLSGSHIANVIDHTPLLCWTYYDTAQSTQVAFEVEVGTDNDWTVAELWDGDQTVSADTCVEYAGDALADGSTYIYRVRVQNASQWGAWANQSFRMNSIPTVPMQDYPSVEDTLSYTAVVLRVTNSLDLEDDSLSYDFEIYADSTATLLIGSQNDVLEQLTKTSSPVFLGLAPNTRNWWRCRSFDGFEYSSWTPVQPFYARAASTIRVPMDQPNIQAGIDAALNFDTVRVSDGVYTGSGNRNIMFGEKDVVLMSDNGAQSTFIDCEGEDLAFNIAGGHDTTLIIHGFTITNGYHYAGGAVRCFGSSPTIIGCIFESNMASYGGAIYFNGLQTKSSEELQLDPPTIRLWNCSFLNNSAVERGSAIFTQHNNATVAIDKSIFLGNISGTANVPPVHGDPEDPGIVQLSCTDIYGNVGGDWVAGIMDQADVYGNFSLDPQFCDAALGDFSLYSSSPCAAANNSCAADVGALGVSCPYVPQVIHVSDAGNDLTGTGSEFEPFGTISRGIAAAFHGDTVLVLPGLYSGDGNRDLDFNGKQIVLLSQGGPDSTTIDVEGEFDHIWVSLNSNEDSTTIIEGFSIVDGFGSQGAMLLDNASPTIRNCRIVNSGARNLQGTSAVRCISSSAIFEDCVFENNTIGCSACKEEFLQIGMLGGAALSVESQSDVRIVNCIFRSNSSDDAGSGGAVAVSNSNASFRACSFDRNMTYGDASAGYGGALVAVEANLEFVDCLFSRNEASDGGGALFVESSSPVNIIGCTFEMNRATRHIVEGGAIRSDTTEILCEGSVFRQNTSTGGGGGAVVGFGTFVSCTFDANSDGYDNEYYPGKGGAVFGGGAFENCLFFDNWAGSVASPEDSSLGGAIYGSGSFSNCTFVGNFGDVGPAIYAIDTGVTLTKCILAFNVDSNGQGGAIVGSAQLDCSNIFGHPGGNWIGSMEGQDGLNGNIELDPYFCDTSLDLFSIFDVSPCAPANNSCGVLIGAVGVGCSGVPAASNVSLPGEDQVHVLSHTPTISWQFFSPGEFVQDSVEVAFGTDTTWLHAEMWNPAAFGTSDTTMIYAGLPLMDGQTYYGRLRVHNSLVWSDWISFSFRMNSVPGLPIPQSPINQALVGQTPDLTLTNATDAEADGLVYDFQVFEDTALIISTVDIAETADSTGWTVDQPLADNTLHWWRARAFDGFEYSNWSAPGYFWVDATPEAPSTSFCLYPPALPDSVISEQMPVFVWSAASDPDPQDTVRYCLITATDPDFTFQSTVDSLPDTTYAWPTELSLTQKYWWKVQAFDKSGLSTISETRSFWVGFPGCCVGSTGNATGDPEDNVNLSDLTLMVNYLFVTFQPLACKSEANANGDAACGINLSDVTVLVNYLFVTFEPVASCGDFQESACGVLAK